MLKKIKNNIITCVKDNKLQIKFICRKCEREGQKENVYMHK